jgi:ATP-dependent Clp protease ATP-binding subunit ClpX
LIAERYASQVNDINGIFDQFRDFYEQIKTMEMQFLKKHGINIVFEEDAIDYIILQWQKFKTDLDAIYKQLSLNLEYGLKLVREKTGRNRFFLTRQALEAPEGFISQLLKEAMSRAADELNLAATNDAPERTRPT